MPYWSLVRGAVVLALGLALAGCGPAGPEIVPVSGFLTRNGKPVGNLEVFFMPTQGRNSVGMADSQGRFTLGYTEEQKGALVGTHTVFVIYHPQDIGGGAPADVAPILEKYGSVEKSPIKIEIKHREDNLEIKLD